jgi:hypothetical protein
VISWEWYAVGKLVEILGYCLLPHVLLDFFEKHWMIVG